MAQPRQRRRELANANIRAPRFVHLLDAQDTSPLHDQIYQRIRHLILTGALERGSRLASSRRLAESLRVSRNSVITALDRLVADGWLQSRRGSGVYVSYEGPHLVRTPGSMFASSKHGDAPFELGVPPIDVFPKAIWTRLQSRRWQHLSLNELHEGEAAGWIGLRESIAAHLSKSRGLRCSPDQIIVTSSTSAGLDLVVRALGLADGEAWIETPGHKLTWQTLQNCGVRLIPVPVDDAGLDVEVGRRMAPHARLAVVTPACQFPTGVTLSEERRLAFRQWATENHSWIFEYDYDWNNSGATAARPLAMDAPARTIYCDTFNRLLFPSLGIAYLVVPPEVVDRFVAVRNGLDVSANVPNQMILSDFITAGHLDRHLKRLRDCYQERRGALLQALTGELAEFLVPIGPPSGSHVICKTDAVPAPLLVERACAEGISLAELADYRLISAPHDQIILGCLGFKPSAMASAARQLRRILLAGV
jgi:GntR family transcriptional regulator/MocR family aminotransferase